MRDVAIIGSGPAGLSSALYTTRAGFDTHVYTGESTGGLLTTTEKVDNYLGLPGIEGGAMAELFIEHAKSFGAVFVSAVVTNISIDPQGLFLVQDSSGQTNLYKAVIFSGGSKPRKLGVPGEELPGVSWCSVCDGAFYEGDEVAVIGGGESAVEEAMYMSNIASKVTLLVRGDRFRAAAPAVEQLLSRPNVAVRFNSSVERFIGEDSLVGVKLTDGTLLELYGAFEAIGQIPQSALAAPWAEISSDGFISRATVDGFFVAGDVTNPEHRQIAVAVGDGARVAMDAIKWLQMRKF